MNPGFTSDDFGVRRSSDMVRPRAAERRPEIKHMQVVKRLPRRPLPLIDRRTPSGRLLPF
jgi:hypothetical protein